jgi:3-oxoacyl-[acyl-carrier protein] reductase
LSALGQATTALITGAGSGIGAACARRFLAEGWRVIGLDLATRPDAKIEWIEADVTDWDSVGRLAKGLPHLGAVVHCAGIGLREPAVETSREEWDRIVAVNLSGAFYIARWTFPRLRDGHGVLVNIGSVNGTAGFRNRAAYGATKAAIISLSKSLAIEWAEYGIRVLTVSPGFTRTSLVEQGLREGKTTIEDILRHTPQRRLLEPQEVASTVFRLVGSDFGALTGANILVDGGFDSLTGF